VLTTLRNDRDHYYRTLRVWEQNLMAHYAEAIELVGESTVAHSALSTHFRHGF